MKVLLDNKVVRVGDRDLLGIGGEARVYALGGLALKIFHPQASSLPRGARQQGEQLRALRAAKIEHFPPGLPAAVIAPRMALYDPSHPNRLVGYAMRRLSDVFDLRRLAQRGWREGIVTNQQVVEIFRQLHLTLQALHRAGVVVGDLNDGNVMFGLAPTPRALVIDADSMQFGGYPCPMAHEHFLDPELYGQDLAAKPCFSVESDWYAFSVLLFASLLYVHPYGGVHPAYPTLLRRAEARLSLLAPAVHRPSISIDPAALPDPLASYFRQLFDESWRGIFPAGLLEQRWQRCTSCGLDHGQPSCPRCRQQLPMHGTLPASPPPPARPNNATTNCKRLPIFHTHGRILFATAEGRLRYLYHEDGVLRREGGRSVDEGPLCPDQRFAISGETSWIGSGSRLVSIDGSRQAEQLATSTFEGVSAFDANAWSCFRIADDYLVEQHTGRRFGQVLGGQTWLRIGPRFGAGFYRAGLMTIFFLFDCRRPGLRQLELSLPEGRLLDAHAVFDDEHVLLSLRHDKGASPHRSRYFINAKGELLGSLEGSPDSSPLLAANGSAALFAGRLLAATDLGLVGFGPDGQRRLVERRVFSATRGLLDANSDLLPAPGGSLYALTTQQIAQLTLA